MSKRSVPRGNNQYYVFTWDSEKQEFTPQRGVRCGPYSIRKLKWALRQLQSLGYSCHRRRDEHGTHDDNDTSVLVVRKDHMQRKGRWGS